MSAVEGWDFQKLSAQLALIRNGFSGQQVAQITDYPVSRIETISDGMIDMDKVGYVVSIPDSYMLKAGDILFSNINSVKHIGKVAQVNKGTKLFHGMNLLVLRPVDEVDEKFLFYKLINEKPWFEKMAAQAINQASINQETLKELQFELPLFKLEQSKIAEVLSTVDQAIEQTEALIAKQQRIKTGLMQDLLTRGIDENGNLRSEQTHEFKDSPLGRIPVEWEVNPLSDLADVDRGKFTHRPRNDPRFYGGEYPFIQTGDVTSHIGRKVVSYTQTLNKRGTKVSKEFPRGTIAITIAANIADTAILGTPMFFPDSVVGAVVALPNNTRFVELMIRQWKPILEGLAPQSAQKNINLEVLRPLPIPTPRPEEQQRIGDLYDSLDFDQERMELTHLKLRSLKTALMQDLLTGKKRVTALLNDTEVASL